jgi:hypothetical protein
VSDPFSQQPSPLSSGQLVATRDALAASNAAAAASASRIERAAGAAWHGAHQATDRLTHAVAVLI